MGVEEEFHLVDALTGEPKPVAGQVLEHTGGEVAPELLPSQIETATPVCADLAELQANLCRLRAQADRAARREGCRIISSGTHPLAGAAKEVTDQDRYRGRRGFVRRGNGDRDQNERNGGREHYVRHRGEHAEVG